MRFPLFTLLALSLGAEARADKYWLTDPAAAKPGTPGHEVLDAVLLRETATTYHLRLVGGVMELPKSRVWKVERDGLTVAQIEAEELALRTAAEAADAERRAEQKTEQKAEQKTEQQTEPPSPTRGQPVEASAVRERPAPAAAPAKGHYDPILGRYVKAPGELSRAELRRELQFAYRMTRDPRYLAALRKLSAR